MKKCKGILWNKRFLRLPRYFYLTKCSSLPHETMKICEMISMKNAMSPSPFSFSPNKKRNFNFCGCSVFLSEKVPSNFFLWEKVLLEQRISRSSQFCRRPPPEQYVHSQFDFPIYEGDFFYHPDFCPFLWTEFLPFEFSEKILS